MTVKRKRGPGSRSKRRELVQSRVSGPTRKAVRKAVSLGIAPMTKVGNKTGTPIEVTRIGKFNIKCTNQGKKVPKERRYLWQIFCNGKVLEDVSGEFRYSEKNSNGLYAYLDYVWALLVQDIRVPDLYATLDHWLGEYAGGPASPNDYGVTYDS